MDTHLRSLVEHGRLTLPAWIELVLCLCLQITITKTDSLVVKSDSDRLSLASALFSGIESSSANADNVQQVLFDIFHLTVFNLHIIITQNNDNHSKPLVCLCFYLLLVSVLPFLEMHILLCKNAARLIHSSRKYDPVTPLLQELHWLRMPQRIEYRLAVLVYRCLHGLAPPYLAEQLQRVADVDSRQRLRSASTSALVVPPTRLTTVGDRAFPVAAARTWNGLPPDVTSSPSLSLFKRRLKTVLFSMSYSDSIS